MSAKNVLITIRSSFSGDEAIDQIVTACGFITQALTNNHGIKKIRHKGDVHGHLGNQWVAMSFETLANPDAILGDANDVIEELSLTSLTIEIEYTDAVPA